MAYCDIVTPPPPDILFFHILPRLPGKSIHRFLCVCKQWRSFLTTPEFAKMHRHHRHRLLIGLSTTRPCKFSTIDLEAPQDGLAASRPIPFKIPNVKLDIIESIRGLVCIGMENKCNDRKYSDIILWNPLTSEHKTVPRPNNDECYWATARLLGFYYSCKDYKLLLVTEDHDVYIYSLKFDSWRKVATRQEDLSLLRRELRFHYRWWHPCRSLNEKLYLNISEPDTHPTFIISFDMKTEKWRKIIGPYIGNGTMKMCKSFMVVRGCIHLYALFDDDAGDYPVQLWRMDGDGDEDGDWTKLVDTYNLPQSFLIWNLWYPLHLMKNGNWVMYFTSHKDKFISEVDLEMLTLKKVYACDPKTVVIGRCTYTEILGINMFN